MPSLANEVRIIGGEWRRRRIRFPPTPGLRPTPDRVRETLFNWLGQDLSGKRCLDLFAGSGALGFEAASRGASAVVMVERDARALASLRSNATLLGASQVSIVAGDSLEYLATTTEQFDIVFLDPPFASDLADAVLVRLAPRLAHEACVYLERGASSTLPRGWAQRKQGRAGQVRFALLGLE